MAPLKTPKPGLRDQKGSNDDEKFLKKNGFAVADFEEAVRSLPFLSTKTARGFVWYMLRHDEHASRKKTETTYKVFDRRVEVMKEFPAIAYKLINTTKLSTRGEAAHQKRFSAICHGEEVDKFWSDLEREREMSASKVIEQLSEEIIAEEFVEEEEDEEEEVEEEEVAKETTKVDGFWVGSGGRRIIGEPTADDGYVRFHCTSGGLRMPARVIKKPTGVVKKPAAKPASGVVKTGIVIKIGEMLKLAQSATNLGNGIGGLGTRQLPIRPLRPRQSGLAFRPRQGPRNV